MTPKVAQRAYGSALEPVEAAKSGARAHGSAGGRGSLTWSGLGHRSCTRVPPSARFSSSPGPLTLSLLRPRRAGIDTQLKGEGPRRRRRCCCLCSFRRCRRRLSRRLHRRLRRRRLRPPLAALAATSPPWTPSPPHLPPPPGPSLPPLPLPRRRPWPPSPPSSPLWPPRSPCVGRR